MIIWEEGRMKERKRKRKREWKDREKKRKEEREQSDKWSSTIRLCRDVGKRKNRLQRGRQRAQPSRMADITNVIIHPTLRPPRVWGTKNVGQWILANPAWPKKKMGYSGLPSLPRYVTFGREFRVTRILTTCSRKILLATQYPQATFRIYYLTFLR